MEFDETQHPSEHSISLWLEFYLVSHPSRISSWSMLKSFMRCIQYTLKLTGVPLCSLPRNVLRALIVFEVLSFHFIPHPLLTTTEGWMEKERNEGVKCHSVREWKSNFIRTYLNPPGEPNSHYLSKDIMLPERRIIDFYSEHRVLGSISPKKKKKSVWRDAITTGVQNFRRLSDYPPFICHGWARLSFVRSNVLYRFG